MRLIKLDKQKVKVTTNVIENILYKKMRFA